MATKSCSASFTNTMMLWYQVAASLPPACEYQMRSLATLFGLTIWDNGNITSTICITINIKYIAIISTFSLVKNWMNWCVDEHYQPMTQTFASSFSCVNYPFFTVPKLTERTNFLLQSIPFFNSVLKCSRSENVISCHAHYIAKWLSVSSTKLCLCWWCTVMWFQHAHLIWFQTCNHIC